jgi:hypothetical protein
VQLVGAVRQDDENRIVVEPTGEVWKQFESGWIGEMDIIDR